LIDRMGRKRALLGLTAVAVGALTILAPATAFAQTIPSLTDTVDSTVDTVTGGSQTGQTVTKVTEPVTDTVDKTAGGVDTVTDNTGGVVDKVVPGTPVGSTKKVVDDITQRTTDGVAGAVGGVKETADGIGSGIVNPDLKVKNPLGKKSKKELATQQRKTAAASAKAAVAAERSQDLSTKAKESALARLERNRRVQGTPVSLIAPPERETFFTQLADAAGEAAKKLAFPLGLALMVGAFLMVQGRIDRKDAKLALAPIDSEQDLLSFQ
jgi:hypothetical protein